MEARVFLALLTLFSPRTLANLVVQPSKPKPAGEIGLNKTQVAWLRALMGTNRAPPMRGAVRGLATFDSRPWLGEIGVPTLVVGGTHDTAVPQYHFDTLVNGIPGARGLLIARAGHTLIWTNTRELADIVQTQWQVPADLRLAAVEHQLNGASMRKGISPQRPDLSRTLRSVGWLSTQTVLGIADTGAISSPTLKIIDQAGHTRLCIRTLSAAASSITTNAYARPTRPP